MVTKRKTNKISPAGRAMILAVVVLIPALFALVVLGTNTIFDRIPYLIIVVAAIFLAVYSATTSSLLYTYFEASAPWYRWIPCYGEWALMDSKYTKPGTILYIVAFVALLLGRLPYSITKVLGDGVALNLPFYLMLIAMVALMVIQVLKGIGILNCAKVVAEEWNDKMHTSMGLIKTFAWFGFIPFVRVIAIYALNKPLSTLVTFNDFSVSDDDSVVLEEAEEEAD